MDPVIKTVGLSRNYVLGTETVLHAEGQTIVVVTHEPDVAARAQRRIVLRDGVVSSDAPTVQEVMA